MSPLSERLMPMDVIIAELAKDHGNYFCSREVFAIINRIANMHGHLCNVLSVDTLNGVTLVQFFFEKRS